MVRVYLLLISIMILSSCDYHNEWDYIIINSTETPISISYKCVKYLHQISTIDTVIVLSPKDTIKICQIDRLGGIVSDIEKNDSLNVFESVKVFPIDSSTSSHDLILRKHWEYYELNKRHAQYSVTINPTGN